MKWFNILLIILLIFNLMVLLGQLWPDGAPPFARIMNVVTLTADVILMLILIFLKRFSKPKD